MRRFRTATITATTTALLAGVMATAPSATSASARSWEASLVSDIASKHRHSAPREFVSIGTTVYFTAATAKHGRELWRTDGTESGTRMVKDVWPGGHGANPHSLTAVGNTLYFSAATDVWNDGFLWKSDGTASGTVRVSTSVMPAGRFAQTPMSAVGSTLYFAGHESESTEYAPELWRSRGTAATTARVKDLVPGIKGSWPTDMTVLGSTMYFTAQDASGARRFWRTDGTSSGTAVVDVDRPAEEIAGSANELTRIGSRLWFAASDAAHGMEAWVSDGSSDGTRLLRDLVPGPDGATPRGFTAYRSAVYFVAADPANPDLTSLWRTDGTSSGTVPVFSGPAASWAPDDLTVAGNQLYFVAGGALWTSDGTRGGTRALRGLPASTDIAIEAVGDQVVVLVLGSSTRQLWASDGTTAGTQRIRDLGTLPRNAYDPYEGEGAEHLLGVRAGTVLYPANDGTRGEELWSSTFRPINRFTLPGRTTRIPRSGIVKVKLVLPNAGKIRVSGVKKATLRGRITKVGASGRTTILLVPTKAMRKKLIAKARHRNKKVVATRVRAKVTYRPYGGTARTKTKSYVVQLRVPKKK